MKKIGEAQVIDFFSSFLRDTHDRFYGGCQPLAVGNFSGSQDRKFADFFAGTNSTNILIEFKENKSEYKAEQSKPLREKLCKELGFDIAALSRQCHFIGWSEKYSELTVSLNPYIDLVCPLWGCDTHLIPPSDIDHVEFVSKFCGNKIGVNFIKFVRYIAHLNTVAGGTVDGLNVPFKALLYSQNSRGIRATIFENLKELNELHQILSRNISPPSPSRDNGPSL